MERPPGSGYAGRQTRTVTRRHVLRAALGAGVAVVLAACGLDTPTPVRPPAPGGPSTAPTGPSDGPALVPQPTAVRRPGLERMIAGLVVIGFRGAGLGDAPWLRDAISRRGLGGVILFDRDQLTGEDRNVRSPAQVARLTAELRAAAGDRSILIGVDQEGGAVTRLGPATGFPAVATEATIGRGSATAARRWARGIAHTLATAGINLNFAPVVDLDTNPRNPAIGALGRSFSAHVDDVLRMASIEIRAHRAAGVFTTLKHFPGIGNATASTDDGVVDVTGRSSGDDFEAFLGLIAPGLADLVMVGHVIDRDVDPDRPASLSKIQVTARLREIAAFDGPIVTDDLQAPAITDQFGIDEAILLALEAGDDLLLFANQQAYDDRIVERVVDTVMTAISSGRLPEERIVESSGRIARLFARR